MSTFAWSNIDWLSLVALSLVVLVVARIGQSLSFDNRGVGALIAAVLFAVAFGAWFYSLHDSARHVLAMMPGVSG